MTENLKTIRELADELGVSKQAVWQKIKRNSSINLRQFTSKKGNTVYINVDGQKAVKSMFLDKTSTEKCQHKGRVDDNGKDCVDDEGEVKFLRDLVLEIQSEKKELHKLLDQQQRLSLQDKQLLEEYKAAIKDLKSLTTQTQSSTDEQVSVDEKNIVVASNHPDTSKSKKWWRFGKA